MKKRIVFVTFCSLFFSSLAQAEEHAIKAPQETKKPEVSLYLEGLQYEKANNYAFAANKYEEALLLNPSFHLADSRLHKIGRYVLNDHRQMLHQIPGFSLKPNTYDKTASKGPIWFQDAMPGYLMIYQHPQLGLYGVYSLKLRFMHNIHYLIVREDSTWKKHPSITLPGVTRYHDILVYHQDEEKLSEGFIQNLIQSTFSPPTIQPH